MSRLALFVACLFSSTGFAKVGFQSGDMFFVHSLFGEIQVSCQTRTETLTTIYDCNESALLPTEVDFFIGPRGNAVQEVRLTNLQDSNSRRVVSYNPQIGQSRGAVNLWLRSVLQRPLLSFGSNQIFYELLDGQTIITSGTFGVTVGRGASFSCDVPGLYRSSSLEDCRNPQKYCSDFFRSNNFCRP